MEQFKTAKFGGYDKTAVDMYIEELESSHAAETEKLNANILKLSETVKNLHTMREVNLNESTSIIDNLKKVNDGLQAEINSIKREIEEYRNKEYESASRYESISRTLLEARENADELIRQTEAECLDKRNQTELECENLINETTSRCEKLHTDTVNMCDELKETTYADCENLKRVTKEETDALTADTEYNCRTLSEQTTENCETLKAQTIDECEELKNQARIEAYNTRMSVKRECESVSEYLAQLMESVDKVVVSCNETKKVADQAFPGLSK